MGYYTRFEGTLRFDPALTSEQLERLQKHHSDLYLLDEDTYLSNTTVEFDLYGKYYDFFRDIEDIVAHLWTMHVRTDGEIVAVGEDQPDVWRIKVDNSRVTREEARLLWPDGTEYRR